MGFMPVNMVLAKKQVAAITAMLYKTAALPVLYIGQAIPCGTGI